MKKIEKPQMPVAELLRLQFQHTGHWETAQDTIKYVITSQCVEHCILYAFVCEGRVYYVGKSAKGIEGRIKFYPKNHQSTNVFVRDEILAKLRQKKAVDIYVLTDTAEIQYHGYRVRLTDGLESTLQNTFNLPWGRSAKDKVSSPVPDAAIL